MTQLSCSKSFCRWPSAIPLYLAALSASCSGFVTPRRSPVFLERNTVNAGQGLWSSERPFRYDSLLQATSVKEMNDDEIQEFLLGASQTQRLYYLDIILIGAGAAGIGVAHALLRGGVDPSNMLLIEKGPGIGSSFREWHNTTRFISPSWPGYPFGIQDLNAVVPDTSVNGKSQHPNGEEYAAYLQRMVNGTNLYIRYNEAVTSIERVTQGCFIIQTDKGGVYVANYVVWAGGEWTSPLILDQKSFPKDAAVHYKYASIDELLTSRRSTDDPILLVGGGEAGADLGCALASRGAKVVIVEATPDEDEEDGDLDPSRRLAPVTEERLYMAEERIDFRKGTKCVSASRKGDTVVATLESVSDKSTITITTGANVVLCTGFDPSSNPVLKNLFEWKDGSPKVTPMHDESTVMRNLFLAGPALMHKLACKDGEKEEQIADDEGDDSKNIIFCFVYKYRTRFAVVACEIINRFVDDQETIAEMLKQQNQSAPFSPDQLKEMLSKRKEMRSYYRTKGFLLTDLSCAQLACGMTANDTPVYDYAGCGCEPSDCETC